MTTLLKNIFNKKKIAFCQFENSTLADYNQIFMGFSKLEQPPNGYTIKDIFETLQEKNIIHFYSRFTEILEKIINTNEYLQELIITKDLLIIQMEVFSENNQKVITFEDITEIQKAKQERTTQEKNINKLIDTFPKACFVINSGGNLESYNNLFLNFTNLNIDELNENPHINHIFENILIIEDVEELEQLKHYVLRMQNFIFTSNLKGGNKINIKGIQLEDNKLLIFFNSESENKQLSEESLKKGFKNMEKELFFDFETIIKTPLQNIINFNNLVLNNHVGEINKRQKEYLSKIKKDANNLAELLEYKIQKNTMEEEQNIKTEKIDMEELSAKIIMSLSQKAQEKGVLLDLNITWHEIFSSKSLLEKILHIFVEHFINQNEKGSTIFWEINKINNLPVIIIKDTCRKPIFSTKTMEERPDLQMAFNIMKILKINSESYIKGRKFREFYMFFNTFI